MKRGVSTKVSTSTGVVLLALGPVFRQLPADEGEDVGAKVGDLDPGEYQEAGGVDHQSGWGDQRPGFLR